MVAGHVVALDPNRLRNSLSCSNEFSQIIKLSFISLSQIKFKKTKLVFGFQFKQEMRLSPDNAMDESQSKCFGNKPKLSL